MPTATASVDWHDGSTPFPRFARRACVSLPALIRTFGRQYSACVHNLSAGGAMIETSVALSEGDAVILSCGTIEAGGTVVWKKLGRCGVAFDTPVDQDRILQQLCRSDAAADRRRAREGKPQEN